MRRLAVALVCVLVLFVILAGYRTEKSVVEADGTTANPGEIEYVSVSITYEDGMGSDVLAEVQEAIEKFPPEVINGFAKEGWTIEVVSEIESNTDETIVGLTNFYNKTIQVSPFEGDIYSDITLKTLHEMSHYADRYYGSVSDTDEWKALYDDFGKEYVEYEYRGIRKTHRNASDIEYASSDRYELFACVMKDYLNNPDYVEENYPELYKFVRNVTEPET